MKARRHFITIQEQTITKSDMGAPIESWSPIFSNIPAHYENLQGIEKFRGRQVQAEVAGVFDLRKLTTTITPHHSIAYNDTVYGIVSVQEYEDKKVGGIHNQLIFVKAIV
jgi:head-tail adaptor